MQTLSGVALTKVPPFKQVRNKKISAIKLKTPAGVRLAFKAGITVAGAQPMKHFSLLITRYTLL
jgi:hypothetical protein